MDKEEVKRLITRGVHSVFLEPKVDSPDGEELVPAEVRFVDDNLFVHGDVKSVFCAVAVAGELSWLHDSVGPVTSMNKFCTSGTVHLCVSDLQLRDGVIDVKCRMKEVGSVHGLQDKCA